MKQFAALQQIYYGDKKKCQLLLKKKIEKIISRQKVARSSAHSVLVIYATTKEQTKIKFFSKLPVRQVAAIYHKKHRYIKTFRAFDGFYLKNQN